MIALDYGVDSAYVRRLARGEQRADAGGPMGLRGPRRPCALRRGETSAVRVEFLPDVIAMLPESIVFDACLFPPHGQRLLLALGVELAV